MNSQQKVYESNSRTTYNVIENISTKVPQNKLEKKENRKFEVTS